MKWPHIGVSLYFNLLLLIDGGISDMRVYVSLCVCTKQHEENGTYSFTLFLSYSHVNSVHKLAYVCVLKGNMLN